MRILSIYTSGQYTRILYCTYANKIYLKLFRNCQLQSNVKKKTVKNVYIKKYTDSPFTLKYQQLVDYHFLGGSRLFVNPEMRKN